MKFLDLALLATFTPPPLLAAAGEIDLMFGGFGNGGMVVTTSQEVEPIWAGGPTADMALYPDDRIVVAGHRGRLVPGTTFYDVVVLRYLANGGLDPTFGNGGKVVWLAPSATGARVNSVAVQPDGKVVLAGTYPASGTSRNFLVVRLNEDGSLDSSFGSGGIRSTHIGNVHTDNAVSAVLVQPDGKIVVAGTWTNTVTAFTGLAVARLTANGSLDTSFGSSGSVTVNQVGQYFRSPDVALQSDGRLVLSGAVYLDGSGYDFAVVRLNGNGTLDTGFSGDGVLTTNFGSAQDIAYAVAIQADDKIVVAGRDETVNDNVLVARYLSNGALDSSFDGDGKLTIEGQSGGIYDVVLQPDSKIVLLGSVELPGGVEKFALFRLNGNGTLDPTFDGDGSTYPELGGSTVRGYALGLLADGRILAFGTRGTYPALVRLWHDGTFDAGGTQAMGFVDPLWGLRSNERALAVAVQPADGKIVLAGNIGNAASSDHDFALARFWPDGRPDNSFGTDGRVTYGFGGRQFATAVAIQPADGKIAVGGYTINGSAINFMLARFNPDGTPDGTCGFGGFNVMDFLGGDDYAYALAFAPDGNIVMGGNAFNGARHVFGVARFSGVDCTADLSLDGDGNTLYEFSVGVSHRGSAVVVQPDGKIVLGGSVGANFGLVRLHENGLVDYSFGTYPFGHVVTDMGGSDSLNALTLTPGGWFLAAGNRVIGGNSDFAIAQYDPNGVLPPAGPHQPWSKAFVDFGGMDVAYALDRRGDAALAVAGCSNGKFAWAQLPTNAQLYTPIKSSIDFAGNDECAYGVKFTGGNKVLTAGHMTSGDVNLALARSLTTPDTSCAVDGDCDDFNACTIDTCESWGCAFSNSTGPCDDGNPCTVGDACDGGICQPGAPDPPPGEVRNVRAIDKTTYIWNTTSGATRYDVVRGSLAALPVGPGGDDEVCFDNLGGTALIDTATPAAGGGFWYLPRAEKTCGNGPFGTERRHGAPAALRVTTTCP